MLEIKDLSPLAPPGGHQALRRREDIKELYPPQAEAVERGLLDGKSMLLALATASRQDASGGAGHAQSCSARQERSLYIVPLRALATEKYDSFRKFRDLGVSVGISTGDFDKRDERLGKNQIIIATSEKADSLMRNGASWVRDLAVLVVDEIHLLMTWAAALLWR